MAGGGTVSIEALDICRRGVRNVLGHLGVLPPEDASPRRGDGTVLELPGTPPTSSPPWTASSSPSTRTAAGARRRAAGRIHCTWDPTREPETLLYAADGMLYGRRQPGRVRPGNCCLVVAAPYQGDLA